MPYIIDAWLEDGAPRLGIRDADTGRLRLHWNYAKPTDPVTHEPDPGAALQDLFKKLMLLACTDKLLLIQKAKSPTFGTECVECGQCTSDQKSSPTANTKNNVVYLRDHHPRSR